MKLNVVPGWSAEKKERNLGRENRRSDYEKWLPPKIAGFRRVPRVKGRVRASQGVLSRLEIQQRQCKISRSNLTQI